MRLSFIIEGKSKTLCGDDDDDDDKLKEHILLSQLYRKQLRESLGLKRKTNLSTRPQDIIMLE